MNAYYQKNNKTTLVTDHSLFPAIGFGDRLISFICTVVALLTSAAAVKIEKASVGTALFLAFFGVIGGMESETLGTLSGLLLCAVITLAEYLLFKSMIKRKSTKN